jgi:hypothetical protein
MLGITLFHIYFLAHDITKFVDFLILLLARCFAYCRLYGVVFLPVIMQGLIIPAVRAFERKK